MSPNKQGYISEVDKLLKNFPVHAEPKKKEPIRYIVTNDKPPRLKPINK